MPHKKNGRQNNLNNQNTGHTDDKGGMLCFMAEKLHTQDGADTAAQDCGEEQCLFRYAPFFMAGLVLILAHQNKGEDVHKKQIAEQYVR